MNQDPNARRYLPQGTGTPSPQASVDKTEGDALWHFSLRIYRAPGVAPACLALQDRYRVDVNLLLCLLWRASLGDPICSVRLTHLESSVAQWRTQLVAPLRELRRELKRSPALDSAGVPALRDKIKALELDAEHLQQQVLARIAADTAARLELGDHQQNPIDLASLHLRHYETMLGCRFDDALLHPLLQALAGSGTPQTD
ncbi:MAG: TIGR02444 family protein [Quisquiliibacterium sp.]